MYQVYEEEFRDDDGGHREGEWGGKTERIFAKLFDDRFECFWYTDKSLYEFYGFLDELFNELNIDPMDPAVVRAAGDGLPDNEITGIPFDRYRIIYSLEEEEVTYFEVEFNGINVYWAIESPPFEDANKQYSYIIHTSGKPEKVTYLKLLYFYLTPDNAQDINKERIIEEVMGFLLEPHTGGDNANLRG